MESGKESKRGGWSPSTTLLWVFLAATVLMPALVGAVTETDFEAKTTQNLLNLCTVPPNDPYYREAINFCEGYLVGAYQYYVSEIGDDTREAFVCLPTPPPSRNEAVRMFIAWAQARPQYLHERPVETEFRFLTEQWPCPR
jgi:Rap1a immunity proteins